MKHSRPVLGIHSALVHSACLGLVMALGCSATPEVGAISQQVAVPGPWNPPDGVRRAAAAQRVDVVDPPNVRPLGSCPGSNPFATCTHPACTRAHPGTSEVDRYIRERWPFVLPYGTYNCRRNSNNLDELSVHAIGRAIDAGIPLTPGDDADNTLGDEVANFLIANAEYIGIQRVGWDGMWWNGERGFIPMRGDPHKNHLHIEMSVDGAARRTRFFTEGPPGRTCPVVCYGDAAVAEDCSFVDCAAMGQVCMSDPVRCETAAPPEAPIASHHPDATLPALTALGPLSRVGLRAPIRVFDTRPERDSSRLMRGGATGPLGSESVSTVSDWLGLPSEPTGVWLNLAGVPVADNSFVVAYPDGPRPETSSLNVQPGFVSSNAALVPFVGGGSTVSFYAHREVHLIADLQAAFGETGAGFQSTGPLRVEDTRASGGPIPADTEYVVDVRAPAGAVGVVATVAVIHSDDGFVVAYPCGSAAPETSSVNFGPSGVVAGTVVSEIADGQLCFQSTAPVELIVDVAGYFMPEGELSYQAVSPVRLLDTREDDALYRGRLGDLQVVELPIQTLAGAPGGIQSVVVNLTSVRADGPGYFAAFPCGFEPPLASSVNFGDRPVTSNVALSSIGEGKLCVVARTRSELIVDLMGVWVPTPGAAPPTPSVPPPPPNDDDDPPPGPGEDGGLGDDAGTGDAGEGPSIDSGCGCRVGPSTPLAPAWLGIAGVALFARLRRR